MLKADSELAAVLGIEALELYRESRFATKNLVHDSESVPVAQLTANWILGGTTAIFDPAV